MPYFICERSRQKFKLSDEICLLKKCEFLLDFGRGFECTAKRRNHEKKAKEKDRVEVVGNKETAA
jgi:hypothetical protein